MRLFRRHRGSQTEGTGIVISITDPPSKDPYEVAREMNFIMGGKLSPRKPTARQVLTNTLLQDVVLADHYDRVPALVDCILLDLTEAGLEIVAREDVE